MLRISTEGPSSSRSVGSPDADRMATLNKELTVRVIPDVSMLKTGQRPLDSPFSAPSARL